LSVTVFPLELEGSRARTDYGWNYASSVNLVPLINTLNQISAVDNGPFVSFMLRFWAVNILGNLILLFPLGFLAPLVSKKYQKFKNVLLLTFLITLSIELFQILSPLIGIGHRSFDIDDIILNTAGGILGFTAYMKVRCIKFYKFSHINADSVETER
jgi:glycopeptide antibiotics resistance protein